MSDTYRDAANSRNLGEDVLLRIRADVNESVHTPSRWQALIKSPVKSLYGMAASLCLSFFFPPVLPLFDP